MKKVLCLLVIMQILLMASAQDYKIDWHTVSGGGGQSVGGSFSLSGTSGQHDAGVLQSAYHTFQGGFWAIALQNNQQPDMQISLDNTNFIGAGIYNDDNAQTVTSDALTTAVYYLQIKNAGESIDEFILKGPGGESGWSVKYFIVGISPVEITADVISPDGWAMTLNPAASVSVRMEVTAAQTVKGNDTYSVKVNTVSIDNGDATDAVIAKTTKLPIQSVLLSSSIATVNPIVAGTNITFTATPTGNLPTQYKFMDGAVVLSDFSASNTYLWSATEGSHTIKVSAREAGTLSPEVISNELTYNVLPALSHVSLTTLPVNYAIFGIPVTLTATATGGVNPQYKFMYGALTLRDFASSNSYLWTPTSIKTYSNITVVVKDIAGINPAATITSDPVSITTKAALTAVVLTTAPANTGLIGKPVTLTATPTGGINPQYKFMNGTAVLRDFSSSNVYTFTPGFIKNYSFTVITRDINGVDPLATITSPAVSFSTKNPLTAVSITSNPVNTLLLGTPVIFTATTTGGANVQYKFMYGTLMLRDFSSNNTYTWTPLALKTYSNITVIVKDLAGTDPTATITSAPINITTKGALTAVALSVSPGAAILYGTSVTITATTTGGVNPLYKFMYGAIVLRDYASSNTFVWTPSAMKTYSGITVMVKDAGGADPTLVVTSLPVNITTKPALTAISLTSSPASAVLTGKPVTLTANATGGVNLQYKFMDDTVILRDFANSNIFTWTPDTLKTYSNITVVVKDIGGADPAVVMTSAAISITVKPALSNVTVAASSPTITLGNTVTLTANATGGAFNQYRFMYGSLILRDFNTANSFIFKPSAVKTYSNITVVAKDTGGINPLETVTSAAISIIVNK